MQIKCPSLLKYTKQRAQGGYYLLFKPVCYINEIMNVVYSEISYRRLAGNWI